MRDIDLLSLNKGTVDTLIEKYGISAGDADYIAGRDKRALQFFVLIMFILSIITAPFLRLAAIGGRAGTLNAAIFYLAVIFFIGDFARFKIRARRAFRREVWLLKTLLEHEDVRQFYKDDGASDSQRYFTESNLMNWRWDFDFVSHMRREIVSSLVKRFDIHYKKIVDLGCGDCGCLKLLESERNICCGIDLNWALLEKNAIKDKSPYLCAADITNVPFRQVSFDVVFCLEALEHILSPATLLEEMGRILKPGGVFIMTTPNRNSIQANCFFKPYTARGTNTGIAVRWFA